MVVVTRQVEEEGHLIMDADNLKAALKPVLDTLKYHGVIHDDSEQYIQADIKQLIGDRQVVSVEVSDIVQVEGYSDANCNR